MAKKIRFPLEMDHGMEVRSVEELREHFSLLQVLMYLSNGKLVTWLRDRYADDLADAIEELDKTDVALPRKICEIFEVTFDESINEDLERANEGHRKLRLLKEYTSEQRYLDVIDYVAFDQDDLYHLLDDNVSEIYLCGDSFYIPLTKHGIHYFGINNPTVIIDSKALVNWKEKEISLTDVKYNDKYQWIVDNPANAMEKYSPFFADPVENGSENGGGAIWTYNKNSYLNFLLSPDERIKSEKSFMAISKEIKNLNYDINRDIADAKSMLLSSGIVGLADDYIKNL